MNSYVKGEFLIINVTFYNNTSVQKRIKKSIHFAFRVLQHF